MSAIKVTKSCTSCPSNNGKGEPNWDAFPCYHCSDEKTRTLLEGIGITDLQQTRAYLINVVGLKQSPTYKEICLFLINCKSIDFDNPENQEYASMQEAQATYWKSTDILENLQSLVENGVLENNEKYKTYDKNTYKLTEKGKLLYAYIASHTEVGELGICPKCATNHQDIYQLLCEPTEGIVPISRNVKIANSRKETYNCGESTRTVWDVNYTCKNEKCGHKWKEEDGDA